MPSALVALMGAADRTPLLFLRAYLYRGETLARESAVEGDDFDVGADDLDHDCWPSCQCIPDGRSEYDSVPFSLLARCEL